MTGPFADNAVAYRRAGLSVIPTVGEKGKRPAFRGFMRYARYPAAERTVEQWAGSFPSANIGLMCGPVSGLTAIDIDDPDLMGEAIMRFGETPLISKGQRGYHLYYQHSGERTLNLLEGAKIDVRGAGGNPLLIAPPSVRPDTGVQWVWERGRLPDDLAKLPAVNPGSLPLARRVIEDAHSASPPCETNTVPEGQRGDWLFNETLANAHGCTSFDQVLLKARAFNEQCDPTLLDHEVAATAASVWRIQENGDNRKGKGGHALINEKEQQIIGRNIEAGWLLVRLRTAHACRDKDFALTPALGESLGWGRRKFWAARDFLTANGFIERTHRGGRGANDPARFRLK